MLGNQKCFLCEKYLFMDNEIRRFYLGEGWFADSFILCYDNIYFLNELSKKININPICCTTSISECFNGEEWFQVKKGNNILKDKFKYIFEKPDNLIKQLEDIKLTRERLRAEAKESRKKNEQKRLDSVCDSIIDLLHKKSAKIPASDIDASLKYQNVDEIKKLCEWMYHNGKISRTANYRYFILTEEKKQSKKTSEPKSEKVDVKAELKKYKEMLDEGLITQEAYEAKMNQLLGL